MSFNIKVDLDAPSRRRLISFIRLTAAPRAQFRIFAGAFRAAAQQMRYALKTVAQRTPAPHSIFGHQYQTTFANAMSYGAKVVRAKDGNTVIVARAGIKPRTLPSPQPNNSIRRTIKPQNYWHMVNIGTKPHFQPKNRGGWMHPGARATPIRYNAILLARARIESHFTNSLRRGLYREVRLARMLKI